MVYAPTIVVERLAVVDGTIKEMRNGGETEVLVDFLTMPILPMKRANKDSRNKEQELGDLAVSSRITTDDPKIGESKSPAANEVGHLRQIMPFIRSQGLFGHPDGSTRAPPISVLQEIKNEVGEVIVVQENSNPEDIVWMRRDQSLVAYILSTLSQQVLLSVSDDCTAEELWESLADTFSQTSEARIMYLKKEFHNLNKGSTSIMDYLGRIKAVADQLAASGNNNSDKEKVQQTLSGLGHDYHAFITALEVLPILPSFHELEGKLLQHEMNMKRVIERTDQGNSQNVLARNVKFGQNHGNSNQGGRGILPTPNNQGLYLQPSGTGSYGWGNNGVAENVTVTNEAKSPHLFGIDPFYILRGDKNFKGEVFQLLAPTTTRNALRVLWAMQLPKRVLLEGSPGVGKTSLVVALANLSGHNIVRINLSEEFVFLS
ncbi:Midasin [Nymphaea thermarum]|nr:Midasin [Nymphaea thermarum]